MSAPEVAVIGGGLGGLAVALRLLRDGYSVSLLEAGPCVGGRAGQIREGGYTFDTGPSLITMPWVLDELFAAVGTTTDEQLHLRLLDPFYRIAWAGEERSFSFNGDREEMLEQIGQFSAADARRYDAFVAASRRIYEEAILRAGKTSFLRATDFAALVPRMARLGALRSVAHFVGRFFADPHVRQVFGFHPLFIGGDPFRVPAVYAALAYLQIVDGVWYSEGGVHALVQALAGLIRSGGGAIHTNAPVTRILHDGRRVRGVRTENGDEISADAVVSNADVVATGELLGRKSYRSPQLSMSCYLLYLGTDRPFPRLHHHTLLVGRDYAGFIRDVTQAGRVPRDMSIYVHAPTRTEPAMGSRGESISVLLPVPHLREGLDWEQTEPVLRERVLGALESEDGLGLCGLRDAIVVERAWTPLDFRDRLRATRGNAFGPEPTLFQSAYFRQPNRDRHLAGMYYVGAGTHPGAGIPGVLLGAEVTQRLMHEDLGGRA